MKVFKTRCIRAEDDWLVDVDTIEYRGHFWLAPEWIVYPEKGIERPARLIGLSAGLPLSKAGPEESPADYVLISPISKDTLAGGRAQGYDVIEKPQDVYRLVDKGTHSVQ